MNRRQFCIGAAALTLAACAAPKFPNASAGAQRAFIVHGYGATPADHWFPWLAGRLKARGLAVDAIPLPAPSAPDFAAWQQALAGHIGAPQPGDIFIAHSLGTISLLHYLSQRRPEKTGALVLVSGFAAKLPALPEINGYSVDAYVEQAKPDLPAIRAMTPNIASIIGGNDSIVAPQESLKLARALHSRVITVPNGGHFLAADGFTELPQVLNALDGFQTA